MKLSEKSLEFYQARNSTLASPAIPLILLGEMPRKMSLCISDDSIKSRSNGRPFIKTCTTWLEHIQKGKHVMRMARFWPVSKLLIHSNLASRLRLFNCLKTFWLSHVCLVSNTLNLKSSILANKASCLSHASMKSTMQLARVRIPSTENKNPFE